MQSKPVTRCKALVDRRNHVKILHLSTMWFVHQEEKETFKQTSSDTGQLDFAFFNIIHISKLHKLNAQICCCYGLKDGNSSIDQHNDAKVKTKICAYS